MAHRSRNFRGRGISDSQRRKKSWIQITGPTVSSDGTIASPDVQTPNMNFVIPSATGTSLPSSASVGLISDPVLDKVPAESTILRLRGSVNLPKNIIDLTDVNTFAIGIGVMEATAAALGAFPNPATPAGGAWDGWMFYRSSQQGALDSNAGIIDVKSMRKVQSGSAIIIVFGQFNSSTDGSFPDIVAAEMQLNLRGLILLP